MREKQIKPTMGLVKLENWVTAHIRGDVGIWESSNTAFRSMDSSSWEQTATTYSNLLYTDLMIQGFYSSIYPKDILMQVLREHVLYYVVSCSIIAIGRHSKALWVAILG